MQILISRTDQAHLCRQGSLRISRQINQRSTSSFQLFDETATYHPDSGEPVNIFDNAGTQIFGGFIHDPEEDEQLGTKALWYPINCSDNQGIADRRLVAESYDNQTCGFIVSDILNKYLAADGVAAGIIQDGPTATRAVFPYVSVSQAMDDLASLSGFSWQITDDKKLNFFDRSTFIAPWNIDEKSPIRNIKYRRSKDKYRNRQYIRAGQDTTDPRTDSFVGDGKRRTFTLAFPVAAVPTITVNGTAVAAADVGIQGVDSGKRWYWNKNSTSITQESSTTPLASTDTLDVTYQGLFPILVVSDDASAITERQNVEGGTGIYEAIESDPNIDNADAALDIAQGRLRRYAKIAGEFSFQTDKPGLDAGQIIYVTSSLHNLNHQEFLIDQVTITDYTPNGDLRYDVHCVDGEALGGWVTFFKALEQNGGTYTIRENEVLVKLKATVDTLKISDNLTISKNSPEQRIGYAMIGYSEVS